MKTPKESNEGLISTGTSGLIRRMDHRLELMGRLIEEIQAQESRGTDAQLAVPESAESHELLEGSRRGEEREFEIAPGVKMTFCWCPPGDFVMGSPPTEEGRYDSEDQVKVTLTRGYWMGKYHVTQAQWYAVMGTNPSFFEGANLPVETVSWNDAQQFLERLNARLGNADGGKMVLPTEAQWEYAARAGQASIYAGSDQIDEVAWYEINSGNETHSVGTKKANAWGLHDMSGNVYEWCRDWYDDELPGGTDPIGPDSGTRRVLRGGGWGGGCDDSWRTAARSFDTPSIRFSNGGFRIARSSVP